MKKILVTFAGRKCFLEILFKYILYYKKHFDEYHIYASTDNTEDLEYIKEFASDNSGFVKVFYKEDYGIKDPNLVPEELREKYCSNFGVPNYDLWNIAWKNSKDRDAVYLKLDDDIIYLDETLLTNFLDFRINNTQYPMIYPLIINNNYSNWLLQENFGIKFYSETKFGERWNSVAHLIRDYINTNNNIPNKLVDVISEEFIFCPMGWSNLEFAKSVHNIFLDNHSKTNTFLQNFNIKETGTEITNQAPMSIGCVSWLGKSLASYTEKYGEVWQDEPWVSVYLPTLCGVNNYVYYQSVVCHYSYYRQMQLGIMSTDILERYKKIAEEICG